MPHLSDGELHAYLDGALEHLPGGRAEEIREHLRTCETCRSRLAGERELLERSGAILDAGAPAPAEAPPLEELRERARIREERAAEERRRGWRAMPRSQVLTWAATVVLALGIGWVTGDLTGVRSPLAEPSARSREAPADGAGRAGTPSPAAAADRDGSGAEAADLESVETARGAGAAGPRGPGLADSEEAPERIEPTVGAVSEETRTRAAAGEGAAAEPAAERVDPPPPSRVRRVEPTEAEPAADEPAAHEAVDVAEEGVPAVGATVTGRVLDETSLSPLPGAAVVLEDSAGSRHAGTLTRSDGRFELHAPRPGTYRAVVSLIGYGSTRTEPFELSAEDTVVREIRAAAEAVALEAITVTGEADRDAVAGAARLVPESAGVPEREVVAAADRVAAPRRESVRMGAGAALQGIADTPGSLHVPGLALVRIEPRTDPAGFLIEQLLAGGDTLRLRWIAGADLPRDQAAEAAPVLDPLPEGWSQVVVRRDGGWLVARAPLSEAELRALLDRPR